MLHSLSDDTIKYLTDKIENFSNSNNLILSIYNELDFDEFILSCGYILDNYSDSKVLEKLIRFINSKKISQALPSLIDFILRPVQNNAFYDLKVLAIKCISVFKDKTSVSALMFCLNDKSSNYKIRLACAEALGKIGDKNAFETLGRIVCDEKEKSTYVRESAVVALGLLGDNRALDVFETIMGTKQMFQDKFSYLKERVLEAMSKLDIASNKKALKILKESLYDPNVSVRISTIETLMNSSIKNNYDLISERFKYDDDIEVRKNALVALYNLSDADILIQVIKGDYPDELKEFAKEIYREYEEENE